ncbi:cation:proton antiporter [Helicovermis profundi]|uniref:Cation:proton antiporter n=1 Tax=Helicovermis profundi TaxID=3065157 RepID=A0AAU9E655_9FIRM|nr:hypothetical protein HLPR_04480 [Clostridia bacterium S502]
MLSDILLIISMSFVLIGVFGVIRYETVLAKLLTSSVIDTAALIMLMIALIIKLGFSSMTFKLIIVLIFVLITNPVINHLIARNVYKKNKNNKEV